MCGTGCVTGVREVATVEELTAALNDAALRHVRITQDLVLVQEIVFHRTTPLVVEGACGGGTRGCTVAPAFTSISPLSPALPPPPPDVAVDRRLLSVDEVPYIDYIQTRLFDCSVSLPAEEELSFIGLTFTEGNTQYGVRPPIGRGAPRASNRVVSCTERNWEPLMRGGALTSRASVYRTAVR